MGRTLPALLLFALFAAAGSGCSPVISATVIRDAQVGARVKTALVNDAELGIHPIEVRVVGGVVRLTGQVGSRTHIERAVSLARSVSGVTDVIADLAVGSTANAPVAPADRPRFPAEDDGDPREPRLLAVGVSMGRSTPQNVTLDDKIKVGPLVRIGSGSGLGPAIGFGWFHAAWRGQTEGAPTIATIRVRPVLGGFAYGFRGSRASLSLALLGGVAFNTLSLPATLVEREMPLSVGNSLAVRPGSSFWFDIDRRFALNIAGSYVMTRPRVRVLENGQLRTRSLRADTVLISSGLVYKIF